MRTLHHSLTHSHTVKHTVRRYSSEAIVAEGLLINFSDRVRTEWVSE